jgi:tetratricopeptide (TPR) repeat protein
MKPSVLYAQIRANLQGMERFAISVSHTHQSRSSRRRFGRIGRVSFWRKEVVEFALDRETRAHIEEQRAWIDREPSNPQPYCNLSQLYRMEGKQDEALGLLLEAVRLDAGHAGAHLALAEIYAVRGDYPAAWRHARRADHSGSPRAVELLTRYALPE